MPQVWNQASPHRMFTFFKQHNSSKVLEPDSYMDSYYSLDPLWVGPYSAAMKSYDNSRTSLCFGTL